jgi:hypothetical protein
MLYFEFFFAKSASASVPGINKSSIATVVKPFFVLISDNFNIESAERNAFVQKYAIGLFTV